MRVARRFAVAMLMGGLVACAPGAKGPRGDPGPEGPAGPRGATGTVGPTGPQGAPSTSLPRAEWRDANGTYVGPVVAGVFLHFDARGFVWFLDGQGQFQFETESIHYDADGCTGNAYILDELPRLVFKAEGDGPDTFRALPDAYTPVSVQVRSLKEGSQCRVSIAERMLLPLEISLPATPIVKPAVSFVGPLRLTMK